MFWLKAGALLNILFILVTAAVFQEVIFWSKTLAPLNITNIVVTAAVSQEDIFPLKAEALLNKPSIEVTAAVFQSFKVVPTKLEQLWNAELILIPDRVRSGSSVAGIVKLLAPWKAPEKVSHFPSPQFVMVLISALEAWLPFIYISPISLSESFTATVIVLVPDEL